MTVDQVLAEHGRPLKQPPIGRREIRRAKITGHTPGDGALASSASTNRYSEVDRDR
jgi:hypothetical protein